MDVLNATIPFTTYLEGKKLHSGITEKKNKSEVNQGLYE